MYNRLGPREWTEWNQVALRVDPELVVLSK